MITEHKSRNSGSKYYQIGSHKVSEYDVMKLWELMCGEQEIKSFLAKCEKDYDYTVASLKKTNP